MQRVLDSPWRKSSHPLVLFACPWECLQQVLPGAFVAIVAPEHTQNAKNKFQVKLSSCLEKKEFSALFVLTSNWLTVDML